MNTAENLSCQGKIMVWDPLARIFHWSLVATLTVAQLTGDEECPLPTAVSPPSVIYPVLPSFSRQRL
jgi:hypothetical protein